MEFGVEGSGRDRGQPVSWRSIRPKLSQNNSELTIDLRHSFERVCDRDMKIREDFCLAFRPFRFCHSEPGHAASLGTNIQGASKISPRLAWRPTRIMRRASARGKA
jgi:hypothetical protein